MHGDLIWGVEDPVLFVATACSDLAAAMAGDTKEEATSTISSEDCQLMVLRERVWTAW